MKIEKPRLDIPPLLLEGDEPSPPSSAKAEHLPNARPVFDELSPDLVEDQDTKNAAPEAPYQDAAAVNPETPPLGAPPGSNEQVSSSLAVSSSGSEDLSESYGTGRIFLMPRDPHWLYAYWDLSPEQQSACNRLSAGNQFHVRVQPETSGAPVKEIPVHPESRHWFFHVDQAATAYSAELGYYKPGGQWETVASSPPVVTPSERLSQDDAVQFASVDFGSSEASTPTQFNTAPRILEPIQPHNVGWIPALAPDSQAFPSQSGPSDTVGQEVSLRLETPDLESSEVASFWTPEKEARLVEQLGALANHQTREFAALLESLAAKGTPSVSSPLEDLQPKSQDFWFHVNAELVIFGATEADASLTIGGQPVQLRDDGTFSLRIALPDGQHDLPVVAVSARGQSRQAQLQFSRFTQLDGDTR